MQARPRVEPKIVSRPADQRQQGAGETNLCETNQRLPRLQPSGMPAHQHVKQQKIDRRNEARRKCKAAMAPAQPEGEKPVEKKVRANSEKAHQHWRVAFADRVKRR